MPLFSATTIEKYAQEAENLLAIENNILLGRTSLSITSGTSEYTIDEYIHSIKRVTWKGLKIDPLPHRHWRENFNSLTQLGPPMFYLYNNITRNKIKFFPTPNETIAAASTTNLNDDLWGDQIPTRVIIEYYRTPDYLTEILPVYMRRRYIKAYVSKMCYAMEGLGQDIKAAKYYDDKWQMMFKQFSELTQELISLPRKLVMSGGVDTRDYTPAAPVLPTAYQGISVDPGE